MVSLNRTHTSSYSSSTVNMAMTCTVSEMKRYTGRKEIFFPHFLLHYNPLEKNSWEYFRNVFLQPSQIHGLASGVSRFYRKSAVYSRYRRTDRQTDRRTEKWSRNTR